MGRPPGRQPVKPTSVRFPVSVDRLWTATARKMNMPKASVLVLALRELAKREGVQMADDQEDSDSGT